MVGKLVGEREADAEGNPRPSLIAPDPYVALAKIGALFETVPLREAGIHPSAVIDPSAQVAASAHVGPFVSIGARSVVGENCIIGAGSIIGEDCSLDTGCELIAHRRKGCGDERDVVALHPGPLEQIHQRVDDQAGQ